MWKNDKRPIKGQVKKKILLKLKTHDQQRMLFDSLCCPVLKPQIVGEPLFAGEVILN
jgi:hypothetical protein